MKNNVTQVHGITSEELLGAIERLENKISALHDRWEEPKEYSVKDLAVRCGVAELTVRNWITEGKVKAKRIGRRIFIEEKEYKKALSEVKSIKYQRA